MSGSAIMRAKSYLGAIERLLGRDLPVRGNGDKLLQYRCIFLLHSASSLGHHLSSCPSEYLVPEEAKESRHEFLDFPEYFICFFEREVRVDRWEGLEFLVVYHFDYEQKERQALNPSCQSSLPVPVGCLSAQRNHLPTMVKYKNNGIFCQYAMLCLPARRDLNPWLPT
jgi:hypothetical protein